MNKVLLKNLQSKGLNEPQIETLETCLEVLGEVNVLHSIALSKLEQMSKDEIIDEFIIPYNTIKFEKAMAERIAQNEITIMQVASCFSYTIGLSLVCEDKAEILASSGVPGNLINLVSNGLREGVISVGKVTTTDRFTVAGQELRFKLIKLDSPEEVIEELIPRINVWVGTKVENILLLLMPDTNNLLPGEEGFDREFDQSFEIIKSKYHVLGN